MQIWELFLIGVSLSMDAFAAAICRGLEMKKFNIKHALVIALLFGGFQALMPFLGWLLGKQFASYIESFDHWIAFSLLVLIGGKMIFDSFKKEEVASGVTDKLNFPKLLLMAIATSIDALAVGVTFAFLGASIGVSVAVIGGVTFAISFAGVAIGKLIGGRFKNKAELIGGIVLVLIGVKILLQHMGVINF